MHSPSLILEGTESEPRACKLQPSIYNTGQKQLASNEPWLGETSACGILALVFSWMTLASPQASVSFKMGNPSDLLAP